MGVIPEDWEVASIAELVIAGPKNGYSGRSGKDARGTPTLSLGATTSGSMVLNEETVKRLDETIPTNSDLYLEPGDVLVQRSNTSDLVGTTAIFDGLARVYVYPDLMMRMRFRDDATSHWFWRYANSASGRRFFVSVAAGSSGSMPKISGEKLRKMQLPLPPLPEQRAIAEALGDVDGLLAALDRLIAKKRDLKQAAMQQLLTGQTRLPGFHGEWEVKQIDEFADCTAGGTPNTRLAEYWGGSIRWMSSGELNLKRVEEVEGRITESGLKNSSTNMIPKKSVLLGLAGQGKTRGTVAMNLSSSRYPVRPYF
ncbi:MAG: restriction endonuclease subunit S [Desulfobulbus sp.]|nr:restriction endonuclease subunit S [Desulfobulbus sp.]